MAHAARPDSTEWQVVLADMQESFVDRYPTRHDPRDVEIAQLGIVSEWIDCQRAVVTLDIVGDFLPIGIRLDWQDRAKELALHDNHVFRRIEHEMRRKFATLRVWNLLFRQVDQSCSLSAGILQCRLQP